MPQKFDSLLSRADDETLQELIGEPLMRLLQLLDPGLATPQSLRELLVDLHGRETLLETPVSRNLLIDLLPPNQVVMLSKMLQVASTSDHYEALKKTSIKRGSWKHQALFDFFELSLLESEIVEDGSPPQSILPSGYALFEHQRQAARKVHELIYQRPNRVVLHMPTGSGKTRTTMNIISEHLRATEPALVIWLAHSEELCDQAVDEFEKAWFYLGNREVNLYRYWGTRSLDADELSDGIMIAGLSKLFSTAKRSIRFINQLAQKATLVIIDEAHSAIAETYRLLLDVLVVQNPGTGLLGLTATPGRTWADIHVDRELADFFAYRKVTLEIDGYTNPVDYLIDEGYLASVDYHPLFYESGNSLSDIDIRRMQNALDIPDNILQLLAEDEMRNLTIVTEAERLAKQHKRIIIFATTVQHSNLLASVLRARGQLAYSVTSKTSHTKRAQVIEDFKGSDVETRILCNFGVLTTGFDAPQTSAAIIARPTKSLVLYSQMVGRAIRGIRAGGNEHAEIVTVVDQQLPGFGSVSDAFNNWEDIWE